MNKSLDIIETMTKAEPWLDSVDDADEVQPLTKLDLEQELADMGLGIEDLIQNGDIDQDAWDHLPDN